MIDKQEDNNNAKRLLLVMAPIDNVILEIFKSCESVSSLINQLQLDENEGITQVLSKLTTHSCISMNYAHICTEFASILLSTLPILLDQHEPSIHQNHLSEKKLQHFLNLDASSSISLSYTRKLILRFASVLDQIQDISTTSQLTHCSHTCIDTIHRLMENEDVAFLWLRLNQSAIHLDIPNPDRFCYVSFDLHDTIGQHSTHSFSSSITKITTTTTTTTAHATSSNTISIMRIRIFPFHNDVGVQRVWEAGCCLAEFLYMYPTHVRGKEIMELGSGVGLTGLFIAKSCQPCHVHMTDATIYCLNNLSYNIALNQTCLDDERCEIRNTSTSLISCGHFNWKDDLAVELQYLDDTSYDSRFFYKADVLIAADVLYDRDDIPYLVQTIHTFLSQPNPTRVTKTAIFATTYRNHETFSLFEREILLYPHIHTHNIPPSIIDTLPNIFPCYFQQPRSHVRITIFTLIPYEAQHEFLYT